MKTKHLVVSMHDVTPARFEQTKQCLDMLDSIGVPSSSLLVVPAYHDVEMSSDPGFVEYLKQRQRRGDEIVLHGFRHLVEKKPSGFLPRLQCNIFSRMECEFLGLTEDEFNSLIASGLKRIKAAGLSTSGFVPPSWLVDNKNLGLLPDHGIGYATRQYRLFDLHQNKSWFSPAIVLWGGTARMNRLSRFYNGMMAPIIRTRKLVRIALHPPDAEMGALDWFAKLIKKTMQTHQPVTYQQFIDLHQ